MELSIEEAEDIFWEDHVAKYAGDKHRWHQDMYCVFTRDGKYYEFLYMDPATEMQEGQDCFENDPVPCYEVIPMQKSVTYYERIEK